MRALGFKYEARKKYYFVDGHEKEGTIKYRTEYVREMLNLEQRMYRWIQLKQTEVAMYGEKHGLLTSTGYNYTCPLTGEPMVEFHVDACEEFHKVMKETMWGGNLSVRMEVGKQPVVLLGHDECIFKQYQFTNKSWVADNKARPIIPKDEGAGLMISAFQGREFGFGCPMSEEDFKRVNDKRKGESYLDEEAAKLKRGKKRMHLLQILSLLSLSTVPSTRATGHMSTSSSNVRTLLTASLSSTLRSLSTSAWTTLVATIANATMDLTQQK